MFQFTIDKKPTNKAVNLLPLYDVVVVGSGPAGSNAAIYAKRKGLKILVITSSMGGQMVDTNLIENYLGTTTISGEKLYNKFIIHVQNHDIPILTDDLVVDIKNDDNVFSSTLRSGKVIKSKTIILATGARPRKLGIKGEDEFFGNGVTYCAICDGPFYKDKDVAVIGGGNAALETALDLAKTVKSVAVIQLKKDFSADQVLVDRLDEVSNITYYLNKGAVEFCGDKKLNRIRFKDKATKEETSINVSGVFIQIGSVPNINIIKELIQLNERGEIIVDIHQKTSLDGVFAAGDITNFPYKQIITAASQGAVAALSANAYLKRKEIKWTNY